MTRPFFAGLTLLACSLQVSAATSPGADGGQVTIPGTEVRSLHSEIVKQDYRLLVGLPGGYAESRASYPVLYLLDAQWDFPLVYALYGQQYYDGFVPALVIVGVTWGGERPDPDLLRQRDFTPTSIDGAVATGGAAKFLAFFERELIPFVESQYRTSPHRTLAGSSLGGLFTLYALFNRPDLFDNYIATSPATPWDRGSVYAFSDGFAERSAASPSRLFVAVSELEALHGPVMDLADWLQRQAWPGLTWTSHVVAGAGHSGVKAEGDARGLQYVFARPELALPEGELEPLAGTYRSADGQSVLHFVVRDGSLWAGIGDEPPRALEAQDATHFYRKGEFTKVRFVRSQDGAVTGCVLDTYAHTTEFQKSDNPP